MANWTKLKKAIADVIKTNGNEEITGAIMQQTLISIVNNLGSNAQFAGVAVPSTVPEDTDGSVFISPPHKAHTRISVVSKSMRPKWRFSLRTQPERGLRQGCPYNIRPSKSPC